ncbi:uncharacterized protein LOC124159138 isoform X1 [Ischnura elegans]|uniref:uncharacterized protein LOC124159138 isoform X1 n=1 Tax=Ischnura elegans TaxID=197161 RepID=UPI001ED8990D|nr:uncharacterized protein LOC124159138 isoform X1 [Ischnura elegans]
MPGGGKKAVFPTLALHDHEQVRVAANEQEKAKRFHQSRERNPKTRKKTLRDLFTKSKVDDNEPLINAGQHGNKVAEVINEAFTRGETKPDSLSSVEEGNDEEAIPTPIKPENLPGTITIEEGEEISEDASTSNASTDDEQEMERSENPLTKFFLSMAETTLTLPQHLQIEVKQKVFDAVIAAETAAMQESGHLEFIESSISERMASHSITAINPANFWYV